MKKVILKSLLCIAFILAAGGWRIVSKDIAKTEETAEVVLEKNTAESKDLYRKYQGLLNKVDQKREESFILKDGGWENIDDGYWEIIGPGYTQNKMLTGSVIGEDYPQGILMANGNGNRTTEMRLAILDKKGWMEYTYFYLDEITYISCKGEDREGNLPEYQVSEYSLGYSDSWESHTKEQRWKDYLMKFEQEQAENVQKEYCVIDGQIYEWDRQQEILLNVTNKSVQYTVKWLAWEAERVFHSMRLTPKVMNHIQSLIPNTHKISDAVICDFNEDERDDYVTIVYQQEDSGGKYIYRDSVMWLLLSTDDGEYEKKVLLEQKSNHCSIELFPNEQLVVWNYDDRIHNDSKIIKTEYFYFDQVTEEFYLDRVVQMDKAAAFRIKGRKEGRYTIEEYYAQAKDWISTGIYYKHTERIEGGITLFFEYEKMGQSSYWQKKVKEKLYELLAEIEKIFSSSPEIQIVYENDGIISGSILCDGYFGNYIIDLDSGEFIQIQELIAKEDFLQICKEGLESIDGSELSETEKAEYIALINREYEYADSHISGEDFTSMNMEQIDFSLTEWGIVISCPKGVKLMIDKEYFIDTPIWKYIKPDFREGEL